jgi:hypothetical protein
MSSGHHQRRAAHEELLVHESRHRSEGDALIQYALDLGIAARECVADDDQIGRGQIGGGVEVPLGVGLHHRNAQPAEQVAHGRISRLVRARDAVALQL